MTVDAGVLRGWSKERAELYGKPHLVSANLKLTTFANASRRMR